MSPRPGLLLCASLLAASLAHASPGKKIDAGRRAADWSTEQRADLPENLPVERNDTLQERRFETSTIDRREAPVAGKRAPFDLRESEPKKTFRTPDKKTYETRPHRDADWNEKTSRYSTREDAYRSRTAVRFQDKISDASPVSRDSTPVIKKRTTFDRINRFVFMRNPDDKVTVTRAGSEKPAAPLTEGELAK